MSTQYRLRSAADQVAPSPQRSPVGATHLGSCCIAPPRQISRRSSARNRSRSAGVSGSSVRRDASSPRRRSSSNSARPSGVSSTISRRRSSALGAVATSRRAHQPPDHALDRRRVHRRRPAELVLRHRPELGQLGDRGELGRRDLGDHPGEDRQVPLVRAAQAGSRPGPPAGSLLVVHRPSSAALNAHVDRSPPRPQTNLHTSSNVRRPERRRAPCSTTAPTPCPRRWRSSPARPRTVLAGGTDLYPATTDGRARRPRARHHRPARAPRHRARAAATPHRRLHHLVGDARRRRCRRPSTRSAPPPRRSAACRSRTPAPSAATSATPRPPPTACRRCSCSTPRSSSPPPRGRRRLPLAAFLAGPRAHRPPPRRDPHRRAGAGRGAPPGRSAFLKLGARRYLVISIAMVAARLAVADGRVRRPPRSRSAPAAPVATRLPALEARLLGAPADATLAERIDAGDGRRRARADRRRARHRRLPRRGGGGAAAPRARARSGPRRERCTGPRLALHPERRARRLRRRPDPPALGRAARRGRASPAPRSAATPATAAPAPCCSTARRSAPA